MKAVNNRKHSVTKKKIELKAYNIIFHDAKSCWLIFCVTFQNFGQLILKGSYTQVLMELELING